MKSNESAGPPVKSPPGKSRFGRDPERHRRTVVELLEAYAFLGLLIVVAVFFSIYTKTADTFPTSANIQTMVASNSVLAIIAIGCLIPLICGEFDLSIGAVAGLSSIFVADVLSSGHPIVIAVLVGCGIGVLVGVINALLVTVARVNSVIATLGMSIILGGIAVMKTGGSAITSNISPSFIDFGTGTTLGVPRPAWAMLLVVGAVWYLLTQTPFGRSVYAVGSNRVAAALVGIRTRYVLGMTFVISGLLCGGAGVLQVARAGSADPRVGETFTLPAIAAAFLGAAAIRPGTYNVWGTLVAIFFLAVLNSGLNLAGSPPYVNDYVNGAALILGVALAAHLGRRREG